MCAFDSGKNRIADEEDDVVWMARTLHDLARVLKHCIRFDYVHEDFLAEDEVDGKLRAFAVTGLELAKRLFRQGEDAKPYRRWPMSHFFRMLLDLRMRDDIRIVVGDDDPYSFRIEKDEGWGPGRMVSYRVKPGQAPLLGQKSWRARDLFLLGKEKGDRDLRYIPGLLVLGDVPRESISSPSSLPPEGECPICTESICAEPVDNGMSA